MQHGILLSSDVCARGIDITNVSTIIQIDAPQDPSFFIHRIGRTARIGQQGIAEILIQNSEIEFINYLKQKGIDLEEKALDGNFVEIQSFLLQKIKDIILSDRDYIEKSKKAFVSFIRSYQEHELKNIFEFKNLQIGDTANSFFLLRIPRIKEILSKKIEGFIQSEINPEQIPFKNKNQELMYQNKKELKLEKIKQKVENQQNNVFKKIKKKKKRTIQKAQLQEDQIYQYELALAKKLKYGKISKQQYERMIEYIE